MQEHLHEKILEVTQSFCVLTILLCEIRRRAVIPQHVSIVVKCCLRIARGELLLSAEVREELLFRYCWRINIICSTTNSVSELSNSKYAMKLSW